MSVGQTTLGSAFFTFGRGGCRKKRIPELRGSGSCFATVSSVPVFRVGGKTEVFLGSDWFGVATLILMANALTLPREQPCSQKLKKKKKKIEEELWH